jgi:hypothetical protein
MTSHLPSPSHTPLWSLGLVIPIVLGWGFVLGHGVQFGLPMVFALRSPDLLLIAAVIFVVGVSLNALQWCALPFRETAAESAALGLTYAVTVAALCLSVQSVRAGAAVSLLSQPRTQIAIHAPYERADAEPRVYIFDAPTHDSLFGRQIPNLPVTGRSVSFSIQEARRLDSLLPHTGLLRVALDNRSTPARQVVMMNPPILGSEDAR